MTAKEYLDSIRIYDSKINRKLEQLTAMRDAALKTTSYLSAVPSGNHDPKRKESLMSKIVDTEAEVNAMVDRLADLKEVAIEMIYKMDNLDYCKVLENKYVRLQTWEEVAQAIGITSRSAYRIACAAMSEFNIIYEKEQFVRECHGDVSIASACEHGG